MEKTFKTFPRSRKIAFVAVYYLTPVLRGGTNGNVGNVLQGKGGRVRDERTAIKARTPTQITELIPHIGHFRPKSDFILSYTGNN